MYPDGRERPAQPDDRPDDCGRVLAWAPGLVEPSSSLRDLDEADAPAPPESPDPFDDLDLAISPVSVTPPRTWRQAAWFAVAASCVVLTVLVFTAAKLAGPRSPFDRLDAFPGLPTGGLLTARPPATPVLTTAPGANTTHQDRPTVLGAPPSAGIAVTPGRADVPQPDADPSGVGRSPRQTTTGITGFTDPTPAPMVSLLPTTGQPPVSADSLITATQVFYDALPDDLVTAWGMVGQRIRMEGFDNFRRQWTNTAEVTLQQVVVNPNDSSVVASVLILTTDDRQHLQQFRLTFHAGHGLVIEDIEAIDDNGGNKPAR